MKKKAKISLITKEDKIIYNVEIEIKNDKISYKENNDKLTNVLYDIKNKILIREDKDIYMEYNFNINKANVYIKDLKKEVNLLLKTKNIITNNKKINIEYLLDNELYSYVIDME